MGIQLFSLVDASHKLIICCTSTPLGVSVFRCRYKEIAGSLENAISEWLVAAPGRNEFSTTNTILCLHFTLLTLACVSLYPAGSKYHLQVSETLWSCLVRCWSDKVYLSPLAHRLWKLTLQLYARYAKFLNEVNLNVPEDSFLKPVFSSKPNEIEQHFVSFNLILICACTGVD